VTGIIGTYPYKTLIVRQTHWARTYLKKCFFINVFTYPLYVS
jgi:hypothetical protein